MTKNPVAAASAARYPRGFNSLGEPTLNRNARRRRYLVDALESRTLLSSVANKIADINQTSSQLGGQYYTSLGNTSVSLFAGKRYHGDGYELWRTDGTTAGTRLVKDINPGSAESNPSNLVDVNGTIFFSADDGVHGVELWKSDGTTAGTTMVKDIGAGSSGSSPASLIAVGSKVFFTAGGGVWSSDGTDAGTVRAGTDNYTFAITRPLAAVGNTVYFGATAATTGNGALFKTDGSAVAPTLVRQFNYTSPPRELAAFNGRVFFNADQDLTTRGDLWASDGTTANTVMVKSIGAALFSSVSRLTPSGSLLYFFTGDLTTGKYELWRTDGTSANTFVLTTAGVDRYTQATPIGTNSILLPIASTTLGTELYRCDGSAAPTLVKEVLAGTGSGLGNGSPVKIGSAYFFFANRADSGMDLWKTDGTAAGTVLVRDFGGSYSLAASSGGPKLYLTYGMTFGVGELWTSDGTTAGTVRVDATNPLGNGSSMQDYYTTNAGGKAFTPWGSSVLFSADDGINGDELWITNPQTGVTKMLADINPGVGSSHPSQFTVASDGSVLFQATTPTTGSELFRLLPSGTVHLAADVQAGVANSNPFRLSAFGTSVYYEAFSTADGRYYYYRYDVSTLTNTVVRDSASARVLPYSELLKVGSTALFYASKETNTSTSGLYSISSPGATPFLIKTISLDTGYQGTAIATLPNAASPTVVFIANDGASGYELWKSDGTAAGTQLIKDIKPGTGEAGITDLITFNNRIYFGASSTGGDTTLWSTDGTAAGTTQYASTVTSPTSFSVVSGKLYFVGLDAAGINNVFQVDGSGSLTPIAPASRSDLQPISTYGASSWLFYVMADASRHYSLHMYTPFNGQTTFVKDLWTYVLSDPYASSTWIQGRSAFLATGNRLYFPAYRPEWGVEPHSYVLDPISTQITGSVYYDRDRNGAYNSSIDVAAASVSVFADLDADGTRDADEPTALTNTAGTYTFTGLDYGTYLIRPLPVAGQTSTPASASITLAPATTTPPGTPLGLVDTASPAISSMVFDRDAATMRVRVVFDHAIDPATLAATDLVLSLQPGGTNIPMSSNAVAYDAATRTAVFTFPSYTAGMLPDGHYHAQLSAGSVGNIVGNTLAASAQVDFNVLRGDANNDGAVNFADLVILAQNYSKTGRTFSQGNFNYDANGTVDFADLVILAQHYNTASSLLASLAPAPKVAAKKKPAAAGVLS